MMRRNGSVKKKDNRGTTLVETLAAFTVLAALMALFFHIVDFSSRLRTQAVDSSRLNQMFFKEIYKNPDAIDDSFVTTELFNEDGTGGATVSRFWLVLDTERTDMKKNYQGVNYNIDDYKDNPPRFRLDNLEAVSYTCTDPLIDEEQLVRPGAMRFRYMMHPSSAVTKP